MKQSTKPLNLYDKDLVEYITKNSVVLEERPTGFGVTVYELAGIYNISESAAYRRLHSMLRVGHLKVKYMMVNSRRVAVYFK